MSVKFTVKNNVRFKELIGDIQQGPAQALSEELPKVCQEITNRTRSGKDIDGKGFAPYKPSYAARKRTGVNLTVSGEMLDSCTTEIGTVDGKLAGRVKLADSQRRKAEILQNPKGNKRPDMEPRPFFGLSKSQLERLNRNIRRKILRR